MSKTKMSKEGNTKDQLDFLKSVNSYLLEQIKLADTKAAWTFSVLGIATAAIISKLTKIEWESLFNTKMGLFFIATILIVVSVKKIVYVIYPRVADGSKSGIFYFRDIQAHKKEEYLQKIMNLNEEKVIESFGNQVYALSQIADKKFKALRFAMISTVITLIWVIFILLVI